MRQTARMQINCFSTAPIRAYGAVLLSTLELSVRLQPSPFATAMGDVPGRTRGTVEDKLLNFRAEHPDLVRLLPQLEIDVIVVDRIVRSGRRPIEPRKTRGDIHS